MESTAGGSVGVFMGGLPEAAMVGGSLDGSLTAMGSAGGVRCVLDYWLLDDALLKVV
jgi:hypothetical protein